MLRLSVKDPANVEFDYLAEGGPNRASDPGEQALLDLCEAVYTLDEERLRAAREAVTRAYGAGTMIDALAIAVHFNSITRVADSTGIELEAVAVAATADLRERYDLNRLQPSSRE